MTTQNSTLKTQNSPSKTAFVSHFDCSRHDTGWGHPDHQGRLPALNRAVYADMLTLHDRLVEVEGRHATAREVGLFHDPAYLARARAWVAAAERAGEVIETEGGLRISAATWDASVAAVGCALTAVDTVAHGGAGNAFCAIRPAGEDARSDAPGEFGLLNPVAIAARYLRHELQLGPITIVELGRPRLPDDLREDPEIEIVDASSPEAESAGDVIRRKMEAIRGRREPAFFILSVDFAALRGDPVGDAGWSLGDAFIAAESVRSAADLFSAGRLVSILAGGYEPRTLGIAAVDHLRALSGLPRASS